MASLLLILESKEPNFDNWLLIIVIAMVEFLPTILILAYFILIIFLVTVLKKTCPILRVHDIISCDLKGQKSF